MPRVFNAIIACGLLAPSASHAQAPAASNDGEPYAPRFLARVIDSKTLEPIPAFHALAGVNPMDDIGWQWQSHTIREFQNGEMQWPPEGLRGYDDQMLRIEAPGYIPVHERFIKAEPPAVEPVIIRLKRDPRVAGRVLDPAGTPVEGARVALGMANDRTIRIEGGEILIQPLGENSSLGDRWSRPVVVHSDAEGRFELPTEIVEQTIVAATHPSGVAMMAYPEFAKSGELRLEPWGKVVARVAWGEEAEDGVRYSLSTSGRVSQLLLVGNMSAQEATDDDGGLIFLDVPPGPATLARATEPSGEQQISVLMPHQRFEVKPGDTTHVIFGGPGRSVVGKLVGRDGFHDVELSIALTAPHIGFPGDDDIWKVYGEFLNSPAGENYQRKKIPIAEDGSFKIEGLAPEGYQLMAWVIDENGNRVGNLGSENVYVEPQVEGVDEPVDIVDVEILPGIVKSLPPDPAPAQLPPDPAPAQEPAAPARAEPEATAAPVEEQGAAAAFEHHRQTVLVVDRDNHPVAGATVIPQNFMNDKGWGGWPTELPDWKPPLPQTTDEAGRATIEYDIPKSFARFFGPAQLLCRVEHPDFVTNTSHDAVVEKSLKFILDRGGQLTIAAHLDGREIAAEKLFLLTSPNYGGIRETRENGVLLPRLAADQPILVRAVYVDDVGQAHFSPVVERRPAEGEASRVRVWLDPAVRVEGRLDDSVPRPVRNGRVVVAAQSRIEGKPASGVDWFRTVEIAADGTFTLDNLPPGDGVEIIACCEGYFATIVSSKPGEDPRPAAPQSIALEQDVTRVTLAMSPTASCEVMVRDVRGHPNAVSIWIALTAATELNGFVTGFPQSHLQGEIDHCSPDSTHPWHKYVDVSQHSLASSIGIELDPGDAVAWHRYFVHGSSRNESDSHRRGMVCVIADSSTHDFFAYDRLPIRTTRDEAL